MRKLLKRVEESVVKAFGGIAVVKRSGGATQPWPMVSLQAIFSLPQLKLSRTNLLILLSATQTFFPQLAIAQQTNEGFELNSNSTTSRLKGRLEANEHGRALSTSAASLEGGAERGLWGGSPAQIVNSTATAGRLNGRVEEADRLQHLYRPADGNPLSKSVKVLSGQEQSTVLQGGAQEQTLDSALSSNNFSLQKMTPHRDHSSSYTSSSSATNLGAMHGVMPSGFEWGIGEMQLNTWSGWGASGIDNGSMMMSRGFSSSLGWDPCFEQARVQANLVSTGYNLRPFPQGVRSVQNALPSTVFGIAPMQAAAPLYDEKNILWDAWYQKISSALYRNWNGRCEQPGEATIRLTVSRQRKVSAEILRSNNHSTQFEKGLKDAVAALNGFAVLDFPGQSQKQVVSFDSVFSSGTHTVAGAYSDVRGELEEVRIRHK